MHAATISFSEFQVWLLFEDGHYSGCGFYSNKYGIMLDSLWNQWPPWDWSGSLLWCSQQNWMLGWLCKNIQATCIILVHIDTYTCTYIFTGIHVCIHVHVHVHEHNIMYQNYTWYYDVYSVLPSAACIVKGYRPKLPSVQIILWCGNMWQYQNLWCGCKLHPNHTYKSQGRTLLG